MTRDELTELIEAHQAETYRYLKFLGAEHSVAEDLLQDAFIRAFKAKAAPDLQLVSARRTWLRKIARNLYIDHCRRSLKSPVYFDSHSADNAELFWKSEFIAHNDGFDCLESLEDCLDTLPLRQREMIDSFYSERCSRDDIAARFSITADGVKMALRRIRLALGKCIQLRLTES